MSLTEEMQTLFGNDIFATEQADIRILEAREGYGKCVMPVSKKHSNASGFVMGGAIFTLADLTASVASNANRPVTVSQSGEIHFLHAAKCAELTAEAECLFDGHKVNYCEVTIRDEKGTLIARASFSGYRVGTSKKE